MRKDSLVLNQGGVPLKPTNGLAVERTAYFMWFYVIFVCAFAYCCTYLCIFILCFVTFSATVFWMLS